MKTFTEDEKNFIHDSLIIVCNKQVDTLKQSGGIKVIGEEFYHNLLNKVNSIQTVDKPKETTPFILAGDLLTPAINTIKETFPDDIHRQINCLEQLVGYLQNYASLIMK